MAITPTYVNAFFEDLAEKKHNLGSDTLKIMLSNTAPDAADAVKADITEISAGNGYTAGGTAITVTSAAQTSGVYRVIGNDIVFTASGGAIATFRYIILYNDTATSDELIWFYDHGSAVDLADTQTYTIDLDGTEGFIKLAAAA